MQVDVEAFLRSGALISLDSSRYLIAYGTPHWKTFTEIDPIRPAFYFPDFFLHMQEPWVQYPVHIYLTKTKKWTSPICIPSPVSWNAPSESAFRTCFQDLQRQFKQQRLKKGVAYTFLTAAETIAKERLLCSLEHALQRWQQGGGHLYGFWQQEGGMLGLTPECLFQYDAKHSHLSTMALAGTCAKDSQELFKDSKIRHEHQLVVEGICQSLEAIGIPRIGEQQVMELPRLCHLLTPIEVQVRQSISFEALVHLLHPTAAVGAFPKAEGEEWLHHWDQLMPRGRYGAPVGLMDPGSQKQTCLVAIRQIQWNHKEIRMGAGCGIVPQSQCDQEWKEIQLKIQAIKEHLGLL